jgi:hypothetical protein
VAKKNPKNLERRELVEKMRQDQARKERTRSLAILGVCVLIVVGLIGTAGWKAWQDHQDQQAINQADIDDLGVKQAAASCDPVKTTETDKKQSHIDGQPIAYGDAPPSFGPHRSSPAPFGRPYYTGDDRPEVPTLVHNLEHGYTIAWYDDTAAQDADEMSLLESIAEKYADSEQNRFIVAPWTSADGGEFPEGKHIALTRWTADPADAGNEEKQKGNWLYCGEVSGEAISSFVDQFPYEQSPENIPVG